MILCIGINAHAGYNYIQQHNLLVHREFILYSETYMAHLLLFKLGRSLKSVAPDFGCYKCGIISILCI